MLILSRHEEEGVRINPGTPDEVLIKVVRIQGDKIRLGFCAPSHIVIHRSEVWTQIQREQRRKEGGTRGTT